VAKVDPNVLLRFNIAADSSKALGLIDSRAAHVARSNDPNRLVSFCRALIDLAPALSLLIARGMLDPEHPDLTAELLAEIDDLGDLLCLPLADPAELRYQQLADAINGDKERELGQQVARLERDLAEVRADKAAVESRAHDLADRLSAALAARVEPVVAAPDAQSLRDKVQKLERIVDQLQDERADLRAELARALAAAAPAQPAPSGAAPTPTPNDDQPVDVLALTRGTRALVVGGQGARPAHRAAIQAALELAERDWPVGEERQPHHYARLRERIRPGAFDFVLFLAGFASHNAAALLDDCKAVGLPVVYVRRGYSPTQIARAISEQLPQPR